MAAGMAVGMSVVVGTGVGVNVCVDAFVGGQGVCRVHFCTCMVTCQIADVCWPFK